METEQSFPATETQTQSFSQKNPNVSNFRSPSMESGWINPNPSQTMDHTPTPTFPSGLNFSGSFSPSFPSVPSMTSLDLEPTPEVPSIPTETLADQITKNTELLDVLKEITYLDEIRNRLKTHFEQRSIETARSVSKKVRERLRSRFEGGFRAYDDFDVLQYVEEIVLEHYPTETYSIDQAKEDRNISKEIASMYQKYQTIIKGTTINVEFQSKHYDKMMRYVFECTCPACQIKLSEKLAKDAASAPEKKTIQL